MGPRVDPQDGDPRKHVRVIEEPVRVTEVRSDEFLETLIKYGFSAECPVCGETQKFEHKWEWSSWLCAGFDKTCAVFVREVNVLRNPDGGEFWCRAHRGNRIHRVEPGQDLSWTQKAWGTSCGVDSDRLR